MQPFSSDTVLAWLLEDEPEGRSISPKAVFNRRAALLEQGFLQPGAIFLNRSWRTEDYAASTEIIMADPYPVPFEPLSWLSSSLDEVRAVVSGDPAKKTWAVIQAFGWNYGSDEVRATGQGRDPTGQEVRALTYLALAHRAQGLFYYVYRTGDYFIKEKADLWQGLKTTVAEIKHIMPLILAPAAKLGYKSESDRSDASGIPAVHSILKELGPGPGKVQSGFEPSPGFYLISINTLNEPVRAAFEFERPPSAAAFDVFSGAGFPLSNSRLVLEFRPLERKVLYFNPAL